ncbi:MAG: bifunctional riboflavin kinase/FAD synthetase, partial [bacterium]
FEPHPLKVVKPERSPELISTFHEKMHLIERLGVDILFCVRFNEALSKLKPEAFVKDILHEKLKIKELFIGDNYRFGKERSGDIYLLQNLGEKYDFKVSIVKYTYIDDNPVNSTNIRRLIKEGELKKVISYLGRPFTIEGKVVKGYGIGKGLGFPTANLVFDHKLLPPPGAYAVKAIYKDNLYCGVANVGFSPTFSKNKFGIEVHLFNFHDTIYHEYLNVQFIQKIREERFFEEKMNLIKQIKQDIIVATDILHSSGHTF